MGHYDYPAIYAALLDPEEAERQLLDEVLSRHLRRPPISVCDPACGPGSYLAGFAERGARVAGNDLSEPMVRFARERLPDAQITHGDMADVDWGERFDAALNLNSSLGHLNDDETVTRHLRSMRDAVEPDGIYLLGVVLCPEHVVENEAQTLFYRRGEACGDNVELTYFSLSRDGAARREEIRCMLGIGLDSLAMRREVEDYTLLTFSPERLWLLLDEAGWDILATYEILLDTWPLVEEGLLAIDGHCDAVVALRPRRG